MVFRFFSLLILVVTVIQCSPVHRPENRIGQLTQDGKEQVAINMPLESSGKMFFKIEEVAEPTGTVKGKSTGPKLQGQSEKEFLLVFWMYFAVILFILVGYHLAFEEAVRVIFRRPIVFVDEKDQKFQRVPGNEI